MYRVIRDLHLYIGLFVSPFVLLFAASIIFLNHGKVIPAAQSGSKACAARSLPTDIADVQGSAALAAVRAVLDECDVTGEIGFIRNQRNELRFVIPVLKPGRETTVVIDLASRSAAITHRRMGFWETVGYLHNSPGPHNAAIRGNWFWTRVWRRIADGTVYTLLFISLSGLYLWFALRAERRIGLALLASGALSMFLAVYGILH
jgi:hypothetical protein